MDIIKITFFLFFFLTAVSSTFGCIPGEREALLELKSKLKDPSNRLESWHIGDGDCCRWNGVICSNSTGHVIELHLGSRPIHEYFESVQQGYYFAHPRYYGAEEQFEQLEQFGGEISPSLLGLKNLRYLDLSNNDFGGIPIPKFLGSLGSLRFLNLSSAGLGGMIPHELGNLSNLRYLNLGLNYGALHVQSLHWISGLSLLEFLDLSNLDLSKSFHWLEMMNRLPSLLELHLSSCQLVHLPPLVNPNFSSLSVLDLSYNSFRHSLIPDWIFGLKNLKSLDLTSNMFRGPIHGHLRNMTSLQTLNLYLNEFSKVPKWISSLGALVSLNLGSNQFEGSIPNELQNVSSIKELDLSGNHFNSSLPNWLQSFRHLEFLNLEHNSLDGKISSSIFENMTSLKSLHLSFNVEFEGGIPNSFKNLCNLRSLSFSSTKLGQEMNDIIDILSGCPSNLLESIDLSGCGLSGKLSNKLGNFKNLMYLSLSTNSISGPIPLALGELKSLRFLFLEYNKLDGTIPAGLGGLAELVEIDIAYNLFKGVVTKTHFANLTNLRTFDGSMNQLILRVSSDWTPPFHHLQVLGLSCWNIGAQFPDWLRSLKYIQNLDLSNSRISSPIPKWFWNSSSQFHYLNLSRNQIHGDIPNIVLAFDAIDLSSNLFEGLVPRVSSNMSFLDFSNNSFSGSISNLVCHKMNEEKYMVILDLGNNLLASEIPDCWSSWTSLFALRLSNNNFSGNIPNSIGRLKQLVYLHLWNNSLQGEMPLSLQNCTQLATLDLGENELIARIPNWIGSLTSMSILILRANKFHGKIPNEICLLTLLQILDLSHNSLFGIIPNCISNFTFMAISESSGLPFIFGFPSGYGTTQISTDNTMIMMKGRIAEYETILRYVKAIDLSSNNLSGEIPKEITKLLTLQSLNLSNNFLYGKIPADVGVMKGLEVLDFSRNELYGNIPQSMANLTFLSMLNLSYNNLSGRIPMGTQLQSFPSSSFVGNEGLRGPPLIDNYGTNGSVPPISENGEGEGDHEVDWGLYVGMAVGFILGFWSILCPLVLSRSWRHAYYLFLDRLWNKIWWNSR